MALGDNTKKIKLYHGKKWSQFIVFAEFLREKADKVAALHSAYARLCAHNNFPDLLSAFKFAL